MRLVAFGGFFGCLGCFAVVFWRIGLFWFLFLGVLGVFGGVGGVFGSVLGVRTAFVGAGEAF